MVRPSNVQNSLCQTCYKEIYGYSSTSIDDNTAVREVLRNIIGP